MQLPNDIQLLDKNYPWKIVRICHWIRTVRHSGLQLMYRPMRIVIGSKDPDIVVQLQSRQLGNNV